MELIQFSNAEIQGSHERTFLTHHPVFVSHWFWYSPGNHFAMVLLAGLLRSSAPDMTPEKFDYTLIIVK